MEWKVYVARVFKGEEEAVGADKDIVLYVDSEVPEITQKKK